MMLVSVGMIVFVGMLVRVFVLVGMPVIIFMDMNVRVHLVRGMRVCRLRRGILFREHVYFCRCQAASKNLPRLHSRADIKRRRRLRK